MLNRGNFGDLHSQHFTGSRSLYLNPRILQALPPLVGSHQCPTPSCPQAAKALTPHPREWDTEWPFSAVKPNIRDPRLWSQAGIKGNGQFRPYPGKEGAKAHMGVTWPGIRAQGFLRPRESH